MRLTLVAGLALSGCGRRALDPCEARSFEPDACEAATRDGGYYYRNTWHSHSYGHPYSYYYYGYQNYTGTVSPAAHSNYARPSGSGATSGTTRGMFGGSHSGHGHGGGE